MVDHDEYDQYDDAPEKGNNGKEDGGDEEEGEQVVVEEKKEHPSNHSCQKTARFVSTIRKTM